MLACVGGWNYSPSSKDKILTKMRRKNITPALAISVTMFLFLMFLSMTPLPAPVVAKVPTDGRPRVASKRADAIIGASYLAIPVELSIFLYQLPATSLWQNIVIVLFVCFIAFCGIGHILDAVGADVSFVLIDRYFTAAVSALTAALSPVVLYYVAQAVLQALRERDVLVKQRDMLTDAQSMAHLGNWEVEIKEGVLDGEILASDEWFRIFGILREQSSIELPQNPANDSAPWYNRAYRAASSAFDRITKRDDTVSLGGFDVEAAQSVLLTNDDLHEYPPEGNRIPMERYLALIHEDDRPTIMSYMEATVKDGTVYLVEQRAKRESDGRDIVIRGFGKPVYKMGRIIGLRGTAQDVTEETTVNRQLREAKELAILEGQHKDIFLATMSHELRTPLTSILGHVELMEETQLGALQKEYLDNTRTAAASLLSLINDILDYSKLVAGMIDLEKRPMDPERVLSEVQVIARTLGKNVSLTVDPYRGPWVMGDATRLRQVLINLLGNALKFTPSGGSVVLTNSFAVTGPSCELRFAVSDTGIGMSPAVISRLFTPFSQGDNSVSRRFGGTGLGLSIAKKIVDAMGGRFQVKSEEGKGSTFTIFLTVDVVSPLANQGDIKSDMTGDHSEMAVRRILVAEDNEVTQSLVKRILKDTPVVDIVGNGADAVRMVEEQEPYDVFLCDMQMPVMDGLTATRKIRKLPKGRDLRIIGLTANAFQSDRDACLEAGMNEFLSKPFKKAILLEAICRANMVQ